MALIEVEGAQVHYRESGSGPPVVCLYGGGASGAQWRAMGARLGGGYRMVTVDLHGSGGLATSTGAPEAHTHDAEAARVRAVLDALGEPAHLVGHSYGGAVAVRLVLASAAGVRSLTVLEPQLVAVLDHAGEAELAAAYREVAHGFLRRVAQGQVEEAWQAFVDVNNAPGTWAGLEDRSRKRLMGLTEGIAAGWYACLSNPTTAEDGPRITVPTLLITGGRSAPMFRRMTEVMARAIPGARLHVIPEAGHAAPVTHPDAVAEALAPHLAGH